MKNTTYPECPTHDPRVVLLVMAYEWHHLSEVVEVMPRFLVRLAQDERFRRPLEAMHAIRECLRVLYRLQPEGRPPMDQTTALIDSVEPAYAKLEDQVGMLCDIVGWSAAGDWHSVALDRLNDLDFDPTGPGKMGEIDQGVVDAIAAGAVAMAAGLAGGVASGD